MVPLFVMAMALVRARSRTRTNIRLQKPVLRAEVYARALHASQHVKRDASFIAYLFMCEQQLINPIKIGFSEGGAAFFSMYFQ
jgi:hypothetical protein